VLAVLGFLALRSVASDSASTVASSVFVALCVVYLLMQYVRTDVPATVASGAAALAGLWVLAAAGDLLGEWTAATGGVQLAAGAALLGGVGNGMLLGHWYLNQPGLKPWALDRLTTMTLAALSATALLGAIAAATLAGAETAGAVLGIAGFGESFGVAFYAIWGVLVVFTGVVVWMARRCIRIRSIQSATGLYYVALLTAGVGEFLIRYLMVNA
jgi:hypothetical protein